MLHINAKKEKQLHNKIKEFYIIKNIESLILILKGSYLGQLVHPL